MGDYDRMEPNVGRLSVSLRASSASRDFGVRVSGTLRSTRSCIRGEDDVTCPCGNLLNIKMQTECADCLDIRFAIQKLQDRLVERQGPAPERWRTDTNPHEFEPRFWRDEVCAGNTELGYHEWVEHMIEANREQE